MKRNLLRVLFVGASLVGLVGCADTAEKKPVGPVSQSSSLPWNTPVPGQGQGQFGMMQQNQFRR